MGRSVKSREPLLQVGASLRSGPNNALGKDDGAAGNALSRKQALAGLALSLLVPSTGQVQKYLGNAGVAAYLVLASVAIVAASRCIRSRFLSQMSERQAFWLATFTWLGVVVIFILVYPLAKSGFVGGGTDRDAALNIATRELLEGRYPYRLRTYLGNLITPLPGSLFLAVPFVLLGNSAYQNLFWLPALFVAIAVYSRDARSALLFLWALLALSPAVWWELVTGSDVLSNNIYVLIPMLALVNSVPKLDLSRWKKALVAILLGIALSSRPNFLFILPPLFSNMVQTVGWKEATKYLGLTGAAWTAVTLPFYWHDPHSFSPLHVLSKLTEFQSPLPAAAVVIPSVTLLVALGLSFQRMDAGGRVLLRNCAIAQAFPVFCIVVLSTIGTGRLELSWTVYGTNFLFFGALAAWMTLVRSRQMGRALREEVQIPSRREA